MISAIADTCAHVGYFARYHSQINRFVEKENARSGASIIHVSGAEQLSEVLDRVSVGTSRPQAMLFNAYGNHYQAVSLHRDQQDGAVSLLVVDSIPDDPHRSFFLEGAASLAHDRWIDILKNRENVRLNSLNIGTQWGLFECGDFAFDAAKQLRDFAPLLTEVHTKIKNGSLIREMEESTKEQNNLIREKLPDRAYYYGWYREENQRFFITNNCVILAKASPQLLASLLVHQRCLEVLERKISQYQLENIPIDDENDTLDNRLDALRFQHQTVSSSIFSERLLALRSAWNDMPRNDLVLWRVPPRINRDVLPCGLQLENSSDCGIYAVETLLLGRLRTSLTGIKKMLQTIPSQHEVARSIGFGLSGKELEVLYNLRFNMLRPELRKGLCSAVPPEGCLSEAIQNIEIISGENDDWISKLIRHDHFRLASSEHTALRFAVLTTIIPKDPLSKQVNDSQWIVLGFHESNWWMCDSHNGEKNKLLQELIPSCMGASNALKKYLEGRVVKLNNYINSCEKYSLFGELFIPKYEIT
jgi:hypothetical protein